MAIKVVTLHSEMPLAEVNRRIRTLVDERDGFWSRSFAGWSWRRTDLYFAGTVGDATFRVMRVIRRPDRLLHQNSFLPVVRGWLMPEPVGTRVRLLMTLHPVVGAFMLFWCGSLGAPIVTALSVGGLRSVPLVPTGMLFVGVILIAVGFFPEAAKAERALRECITSRPTSA